MAKSREPDGPRRGGFDAPILWPVWMFQSEMTSAPAVLAHINNAQAMRQDFFMQPSGLKCGAISIGRDSRARENDTRRWTALSKIAQPWPAIVPREIYSGRPAGVQNDRHPRPALSLLGQVLRRGTLACAGAGAARGVGLRRRAPDTRGVQ